jgi:hypothetical protein
VKKISASPYALQQGDDIEVIVKLQTGRCSIPVDSKDTMKATHVSVHMPEGLGTYPPAVELGGFEDAPVTGDTRKAHEVTGRFVLHASRQAPLGEYLVPATFRYTAEDASGNIGSYSLAVNIPVQVVAPPAKPSHSNQNGKLREVLSKTGLVLLAIALLPVAIVLGLLGGLNDC